MAYSVQYQNVLLRIRWSAAAPTECCNVASMLPLEVTVRVSLFEGVFIGYRCVTFSANTDGYCNRCVCICVYSHSQTPSLLKV